MNKNYKKSFMAHVVACVLLGLPVFVLAGPTIENPIKADNIQKLLIDLMTVVIQMGYVVVIFFIIYAGFKFVTARGNPGELEKAKETFFATLVGGAILLGADVIARVVVNTVDNTVR